MTKRKRRKRRVKKNEGDESFVPLPVEVAPPAERQQPYGWLAQVNLVDRWGVLAADDGIVATRCVVGGEGLSKGNRVGITRPARVSGPRGLFLGGRS